MPPAIKAPKPRRQITLVFDPQSAQLLRTEVVWPGAIKDPADETPHDGPFQTENIDCGTGTAGYEQLRYDKGIHAIVFALVRCRLHASRGRKPAKDWDVLRGPAGSHAGALHGVLADTSVADRLPWVRSFCGYTADVEDRNKGRTRCSLRDCFEAKTITSGKLGEQREIRFDAFALPPGQIRILLVAGGKEHPATDLAELIALEKKLAKGAGDLIKKWAVPRPAEAEEAPAGALEPARPASPAVDPKHRDKYLRRLLTECLALPLTALGGNNELTELTLNDVYIELETRSPALPRGPKAAVAHADEQHLESGEARRLTAMAAATKTPRLVLLGDPGSGKSTFVKRLTALQAAGMAKNPHAVVLPKCFHDLLPVFITLRYLAPELEKFAAALAHPADQRLLPDAEVNARLSRLVRAHAVASLARQDAASFAAGLEDAFDTGQMLLLFDGLDEVGQHLRDLFRRAVTATIAAFQPARVIVTCRTRSYGPDVGLSGFTSHELADFTEKQISRFCAAWYAACRCHGVVDVQEEKKKTDDLTRAALAEDLQKLAKNPMLLTTIAIIHQQNTRLPNEKVKLYALAVDVLVQKWQASKAGALIVVRDDRDDDKKLASFFGDPARLRAALAELAFHIVLARREPRRTADRSAPAEDEQDTIDYDAALKILRHPDHLGSAGLAERFLQTLIATGGGLFKSLGGSREQVETFSFPHRTFAEYLAGCHFLRGGDTSLIAPEFEARAAEGDYWGVAARLGLEEFRYRQGQPVQIRALAARLCPAPEETTESAQRQALWSAYLANLIGCSEIPAGSMGGEKAEHYLKRLRDHLVAILTGSLTAAERAEAGGILATLGDPRAGVGLFREGTRTGLPEFQWVPVPGTGVPKGKRATPAPAGDLPYLELAATEFSISRYPVTVAQYAAFVQAGGYENETWWRGAGRDWLRNQRPGWQQEKRLPGPKDYDPVFQTLNHPRVGVTWHEATAFCAWLSATLYPNEPVPPVRLPTEAEWELAARGPAGRAYPWGDEAEDLAARCNMGDTNLRHTSPVGMFPRGDTPPEAGAPGIADLAGNVWEWCATPYVGKFLDAADYRRQVGKLEKERMIGTSGVLRGGSWGNYDPRDLLSSFRGTYAPDDRGNGVGFRLVLVGAGGVR